MTTKWFARVCAWRFPGRTTFAWWVKLRTETPRLLWPAGESPTWSFWTCACPARTDLQAAREITTEVPETAVLMFTAYGERSLLTRGLEAGAKGYILKEAPQQTLVRAIQKVAGGDGYVDPALMPAFLSKDRENMLTAREREILQLLADGMSNADVAGKLFISQETVKSHVRHILSKLEADTRTHAVAIALRQAIID